MDLNCLAQAKRTEFDRTLAQQLSKGDKSDLIIADQLTEEEKLNPALALKRLLCTRSEVSTSLSLITLTQVAIGLRGDGKFREIGRGSTGQVYEHPGDICVYKCALIDAARTRRLWNNYGMHHHIQEAFNRPRTINIWDVEIPHCFWYANESSGEFWDHDQSNSPENEQKRRQVYCLERVFPVPRIVQEHLIELYCAPASRGSVRANIKSYDSLIRICLGRRRRPDEVAHLPSFHFQLRDFPLYLDQVESIGLNIFDLVKGMADALARLHLSAQTDGCGVKILLGSAPTDEQKIRQKLPDSYIWSLETPTDTHAMVTHSVFNRKNHLVRLWMLDFDRCRSIDMDYRGVETAVEAFLQNDHFPRPVRDDPYAWSAWKTFRDRYLRTGMEISPHGDFPDRFIKRVLREYNRMNQGNGYSR